jgi:hypothetical protein
MKDYKIIFEIEIKKFGYKNTKTLAKMLKQDLIKHCNLSIKTNIKEIKA